MIIRYSIAENVLYFLARRVSKSREIAGYDMLDVFVVDSPDEVFREIVDAARRYANDVLSEFDKEEDRKEAAIVLRFLATWAPEARAYLRSPPDEVIGILREYILHSVGLSSSKPRLSPDVVYQLTKYLPLRVYIEDSVIYVIAPSFREPRIADLNDAVLNTLRRVYLEYFGGIDYDPYTQTVLLNGKPLLRVDDEKRFVEGLIKGISGSKLFSKVVRGVHRKYAEVFKAAVGKAILFESEEVTEYSAKLIKNTTSTTLSAVLGVDIPKEVLNRDVELSVWVSASHWSIDIRFSAKSPFAEDVVVVYSAPLHEAESLASKLPELFKSAMEAVVKWENLAYTLDERMREAGFKSSKDVGRVKYRHSRGACKIEVYLLHAAEDGGSLVVDVTAYYNGILNKDEVMDVLIRRGYTEGLAKFGEPGVLKDVEHGTTILRWSNVVLGSEDAIKEFVDKLMKLEDALTEAKSRTALGLRPVVLDSNRGFAAYLVLLFAPGYFRFDVDHVLQMARQRMSQPDIAEVLDAEMREAVQVGKSEVLITKGDKIALVLLERGKMKLLNDGRIQIGTTSVDLRELGFSDGEAKEIIGRIATGLLMAADANIIANIWYLISDEVKKAYIERLPEEELVKLLTSDYLSSVLSDVSQAILERATRGSPALKTVAYYRYARHIFGVKSVNITAEPGVPAINAGVFYVHVYDVGSGFVDYIVYGKNEKVGVVYRGRTLREAIAKALRTYDKAVRKASLAESETRLGSLRVPLKGGKPIHGDEQEEEEIVSVSQ